MTAPLNVGTLAGYVTIDPAGVDKGLAQAKASIVGFGKDGAAEAGKAGAQIGDAAGTEATKTFGKAEGPLVAKTKGMFGSVGRAAATILGGIGVAQILTKGWDRLTGIENARAMLKGLGHDADEVTGIMDNALVAVKGTAFGLDEAAKVAANAVAAGIEPGQELEYTLRLVADAAALTNSDYAAMGDTFNKVAALGHLNTVTMLQLQSQGIPVLIKIAEHYGITNEAAQKMVTDSKVSFAEFATIMEETVGGTALAMGETTTGALKNMGAAVSRLGATILEDVAPMVRDGAGIMITALDGLGKGIGLVIGGLKDLPGPVQAGLLAMGGFVALQKLGVFTKLASGATKLVDGIKAVRSEGSLASGTLEKLGKAGALAAVGVAVAGIKSAWDQFNKTLVDSNELIDENTGLLLDNADATIKASLVPYIDELNNAGINMDAYVEAIKNGGPALDRLNDQLWNSSGFFERWGKNVGHTFSLGIWTADSDALYNLARNQSQKLIETRNAITENNRLAQRTDEEIEADRQRVLADSAYAVHDAYGYMNTSLEEHAIFVARAAEENGGYADSWSRLDEQVTYTVKGFSDGATQADKFAAAMADFDQKTKDADQRLKWFTINLDELAGRNVDLEQATKLLNDQVRALKDGFEAGTKATDGNIESLITAAGKIDTTSEAGSKLYDVVSNYRDAYDKATAAAYENGEANNGAAQGMIDARDAADEARAKFLEQAEALGINEDVAIDLAEAMGILEGKKLTPKELRVTDNVDDVEARIDRLNKIKLLDKTFDVQERHTIINRLVNAPVPGMADGGWVTGGQPGRDSVPAMLMPGEFVLSRDMLAGRVPVPAAVKQGVQGSSAPIELVVTLRGDGPIMEAALGAANVVVDGRERQARVRVRQEVA